MKQTPTTLGAFRSADIATIPIAGGVLTITSAMVIAQAQTGTSDDIDTITPSIEGINSTDRYFVLIEADAGDTIILKHGTGNLSFVNSTNITLTSGERALLFGSAALGFDDIAVSSAGGGSGDISADTLTLNDGSELTIATGVITLTKARHTVDTEADAPSDDLVTINGLATGEICIISASHTDRTVVVKNSGGNIACSTGADISLDATEKEVLLYGRASTVLAIPLYNLGSGGGGANTALSNLAAVAINTSLVSDTNDTDDLGSASIQWKDIWAKSSYANAVMAAYNNTGSTIATEQTVYINGHNAGTDEPTIALADRDSAASAYAVGVTQASISNTASGRIITQGIVTYPTTGMAAGDILYLSSTAGALTNTKPTSGYLQVVAVVIEVGGAGAGRILLIPQSPLDLDSLGGGATLVAANTIYKPGSNYTTSSTSFSDVDSTNVKVTATLVAGGKVDVSVDFVCQKNTGGSGYARITDGTNNSNEREITSAAADREVTLRWIFDSPGAGSATYKLQFRSSDANVFTIFASLAINMNLLQTA